MGNSRAMGYSDYYKNNSSTPGEDTEEDSSFSLKITMPGHNSATEAMQRRKAAIKRRLQMRKAGN